MNHKEKGRFYYVLQLITYIKEYRWYIIFSMLVTFILKLIPMLTTFILSYMVGLTVAGKIEGMVDSYLLVLFILVIAQAIMGYVDIWIAHDIAYRVLAKLRIKLYEKIEELSPAFLQGNRSGRIVSIALQDVESLEWFYAHTFGIAIVTFFITITAGVFLTALHPFIALTIVPFILIVLFLPTVFKKTSDKDGDQVRTHLAELNAEMIDGVNGIKDIISWNWQKNYYTRFKNTCLSYEKAKLKDGKRRGVERLIIAILIPSSMFCVMLVSANLVTKGILNPTLFPVAVTISGAIFAPIITLLNMSTRFGIIFASAKRVFFILHAKPSVEDTGTEIFSPQQENTISVKNITFTYPEEASPVIKDVSFDIKTGEIVAIAGASGAGKSTIFGLLQRFWECDEGEILFNDKPIKDYTLHSLRSQTAVVPQDIYLFNTSILENLQIANPLATDQDIILSAKMAMMHEFVEDMPDNYKTIVGERGARLSGGQKQRIALARAFLKNTPILLLDEASSSLDSENESYLNSTLKSLKKQKAVVIIAHRLSTLKNADRIIFLHEGTVIDSGTFDELISRCPMFKEVSGLGL